MLQDGLLGNTSVAMVTTRVVGTGWIARPNTSVAMVTTSSRPEFRFRLFFPILFRSGLKLNLEPEPEFLDQIFCLEQMFRLDHMCSFCFTNNDNVNLV